MNARSGAIVVEVVVKDEWGNRREVCFEFGNLDLGYRADEMSQSGVMLVITRCSDILRLLVQLWRAIRAY